MGRSTRGEGPDSATPSTVSPVVDAAVAAALAFCLSAATACRTVFSGDSAELTTAVARFGIPHPPGYPLYTLLNGLFVHLFPLASRAFGANLASAVHGALAVGLSLLVFRRLGASRASSALGAVVLALGRTFWGQSVAAEVYAFDIMLLALAAAALISALSRAERQRWALAGLAVGLWLGHRPINLLYLPALVIVAREAPGGERGRIRPLAALGGLAAAALPYLYLPLASLRDPGLDVGDPDTWSRFWTVVTCSPYARHIGGGGDLAWGRLLSSLHDLPLEIGVGVVAAPLSLWAVRRGRDSQRMVTFGLLVLLAANLVLASRYNVLDARVFYLPGLWALAALAALGLASVRNRLALAAFCALALVPGYLNLAANDLRRERATARLGADLLASAPSDAVLFVYGDTAAHALWYAQEVEQVRQDVLVISLGHLEDWYVEQLRERHPEDRWPDWGGVGSAELYLPRLLESLGSTRPVTFAMDPGAFLRWGPDAWWAGRTVVPRGLLFEVAVRRPPPDRRALAELNARFWSERPAEVESARRSADLETSMIHLHYAAAALRCGELAARQGMGREAAELFRRVLALDTGQVEREVEQAFHRIGQERPPLRLAERASRAQAVLEPSRESVDLGPAGSGRPNVLVLLWDTVRSDRMSLYGYPRATTPFLDQWSRGARVFDDCLSIASTTVPAHASLLTGLLPHQHGADNVRAFLRSEHETLAETFRQGGYQTCLYSENPLISRETGFGQGFDAVYQPWDEALRTRAAEILEQKIPARYRHPELARKLRERGITPWALSACGSLGERVVTSWLAQRDPERPFFVFANYMEAHAPVITPERWRQRLMGPAEVERSYLMNVTPQSTWLHAFGLAPFSTADLEIIGRTYDAALSELDDHLRGLVERLESERLLDETVVVVVSDHGEHLGEHHMLDHQYSLYQPLLRVPLILRYPERVRAGRESRPVMNTDLYPTLLELAGLEPPAATTAGLIAGVEPQAVSLLAPLEERARLAAFPSVPTPPFDEVRRVRPEFDPTPFVRSLNAVQRDAVKLIWASDGRHELYDLAHDPDESRNLYRERPQDAEALTGLLRGIVEAPPPLTPAPEGEAELTPQQEEILRSLGYLGPGREAPPVAGSGSPTSPAAR